MVPSSCVVDLRDGISGAVEPSGLFLLLSLSLDLLLPCFSDEDFFLDFLFPLELELFILALYPSSDMVVRIYFFSFPGSTNATRQRVLNYCHDMMMVDQMKGCVKRELVSA